MAAQPLVLLHGFADSARTWELARPALERHHDVLAVPLPGHLGGPALEGEARADALVDAVERAMDEAGHHAAHLAGNSLGGYLALRLAERARALTVVAFAPVGGWAPGDESYRGTLALQSAMLEQMKGVAPHAGALLATPEGRRRATAQLTTNYEHIPAELLAHQMMAAARADAGPALIEAALRDGWPLDAERIGCPVRIVWGTADALLPWPAAAERYRRELPHADWIELDGVGHAVQLDVPLEAAELILGFASR